MPTIAANIRYRLAPAIQDNCGTFYENLGPTPLDKVSAVAKFTLACGAVTAIGLYDAYPALTTVVSTGIVGAGAAVWFGEAPHPTDARSHSSYQKYGRYLDPKEWRLLIDNTGRVDGRFHIRSILAGMLAANCIVLIINLIRRHRVGALWTYAHQRLMTQGQVYLLLPNAAAFAANIVWTFKDKINYSQDRIQPQADASARPPPELSVNQRLKKFYDLMGDNPAQQAISALQFALAAGLTLGVGLRHRYPRLHVAGMTVLFGVGFIWKDSHSPNPLQLFQDRIDYGYFRHYHYNPSPGGRMIDDDWQIGPVGIRSMGFGILAGNLATLAVLSVRHFKYPGRSLIPGSVLALLNGSIVAVSAWNLTDAD